MCFNHSIFTFGYMIRVIITLMTNLYASIERIHNPYLKFGMASNSLKALVFVCVPNFIP